MFDFGLTYDVKNGNVRNIQIMFFLAMGIWFCVGYLVGAGIA